VFGGPSSGGKTARSLQYEILNIIEFSSKRKRMSVIVKDFTG
jgi:magnesium-transporting ATPase (P-type)